jgi:DNA repair ATPase RecN
MPDELHKRVKELAKKYGTSVTGLINTTMKGLTESEGLVALEKRVTELEIEFKLIKKEK